MSTIASNVYQSTAENSPKLIQYLHSFGVGLSWKWSQTSLLGIKKTMEIKKMFPKNSKMLFFTLKVW